MYVWSYTESAHLLSIGLQPFWFILLISSIKNRPHIFSKLFYSLNSAGSSSIVPHPSCRQAWSNLFIRSSRPSCCCPPLIPMTHQSSLSPHSLLCPELSPPFSFASSLVATFLSWGRHCLLRLDNFPGSAPLIAHFHTYVHYELTYSGRC